MFFGSRIAFYEIAKHKFQIQPCVFMSTVWTVNVVQVEPTRCKPTGGFTPISGGFHPRCKPTRKRCKPTGGFTPFARWVPSLRYLKVLNRHSGLKCNRLILSKYERSILGS